MIIIFTLIGGLKNKLKLLRIRKFNESEEVELSPERLGEIVESLRESL